MLLNRGQRTVRVINGNATAYDWNLGGGAVRNSCIYYGVGVLRK